MRTEKFSNRGFFTHSNNMIVQEFHILYDTMPPLTYNEMPEYGVKSTLQTVGESGFIDT